MTLSPSEAFLVDKGHPMFGLWATRKGVLFPPKEYAETEEDKQWDLTSKAYIFMKRLGQDYNQVMLMDADERDKIFGMELELIKEEAKQNKDGAK